MIKSTKRRGTVLVLILGALALISIVTLVYVSLGQSDRRSAAVTVQKSHVEDVGARVGEYIANIIADATFATTVDGLNNPSAGIGANNQPVLVRRLADYPYTDPQYRSTPNAAQRDLRRFDPTGSQSFHWTISPLDPRVPGSPYLAASRPTWLEPTGNEPVEEHYLYHRDWYNITNIAPDGRFVNKFNLRNNFDARAGDMTWGLTLLDGAGLPTTNLPFNAGQADKNIPAHWTMFQRRAVRTTSGVDWPASVRPVDSSDYPHNQWADTTGDGIFDSRWFELVDATEPNSILSLLPRDGRYRWLAAARIVDLSSMVNINTATDFQAAPRSVNAPAGSPSTPVGGVLPVGRTPADIDLRRLLQMSDSYLNAPTAGHAYQLLALNAQDPYDAYNQQAANLIGTRSYVGLASWLRPQVAPDTVLGADFRLFYYEDYGARNTGSLLAPNEVAFSTLFGNADLLELLTYHGVNSPRSSRLEEVFGGWDAAGNPGGRLSPLRDNRSIFEERDDQSPNPARALERSLARAYFDIRQLLTTVSGARPLRASVLPSGAYRGSLTSEIDEGINADTVLNRATRLNSPDPSELFDGYARALMPHAWRQHAWRAERRWLHYGYDAELALRLAAHKTANMAATYAPSAAGQVRRPRPFTLLIDGSNAFLNSGGPNNPGLNNELQYPWWTPRGNPDQRPRSLDLGSDRLGGQPGDVPLTAQAVNIWGIEPQPFITQVAAFHLYTDAPNGITNGIRPGGDVDWDDDPLNPNQRIPITISGGSETDRFSKPTGYIPVTPSYNPDYLGQFVAFQLTNPFDVEINLTGTVLGNPGYTDYYIEFGAAAPGGEGTLFRLQSDRPGSGGTQASSMRLRPGESRIAIAMSHPYDRLDSRLWRAVGASEGDVLRFIDQQMSVERHGDDASYAAGELTPDGLRVRPWIIHRMDPATGAPNPAPESGVDLFTGGADANRTAYLWRKVDHPNATYNTIPTANPSEYRSSHMLVDRIRDPAPTGRSTLDRRLPTGNHDIDNTTSGPEEEEEFDNTGFSIALWGTLRRRDTPQPSPRGALPAYCIEAKWGGGNIIQNMRENDGVGLTSLSKSDFSGDNAAHSVSEWINKIALSEDPGVEPRTIINSLTQHPATRSGHIIPSNQDQGTPREYSELYPLILLNHNRFQSPVPGVTPPQNISVLRVADMLLPLAIGPSHDPNASTAADPYAGWITLGEAMAMALNYSTPPQNDPHFGIWHRVGETADPDWGALDRGNLILDRFVPYDFVNNVVHTRFPGIPLALNILNTFRVHEFGSITQKTPGLVNINTASLPVLRTIPMLSPTPEWRPPPANNWQWEDWKSQSGLAAGATLPDLDNDVAAAFQAYRDKIPVFDRGGIRSGDPAVPNRFYQETDLRLLLNPHATNPPPPHRGNTTDIERLREHAGIATTAEIMAIRSRDTSMVPLENSIDLLAADGAPSGTAGMSTAFFRNDQGELVPNAITDSFEEQLLIASGAMGSISVRSDVFAVWFLIHGYQRADTENLGPDDPLLPSIAKRYVMVVDRSNVTSKGQAPEILLFKEVPIR